MAKGPPAADRRNDMPPLVGQLALRVMAAIPCMDIDLAVGLIMFVRDRHRVGLDPVADREPLKAAAQIGRQLRHLVIVAKDHNRSAKQRIDDQMIKTLTQIPACNLVGMPPSRAQTSVEWGT